MNERIKQIIEYYGISIRAFEQKICVSEGLIYRGLSRNSDFGSSVIVKILNNCSEISTEWLVLGEGKMLKNDSEKSQKSSKPYPVKEEHLPVASEDTTPMSQPSTLWARYDAAQQEIGSLRERLAQAATTIANLHNELIESRKKQPSPSAPTTSEPILV